MIEPFLYGKKINRNFWNPYWSLYLGNILDIITAHACFFSYTISSFQFFKISSGLFLPNLKPTYSSLQWILSTSTVLNKNDLRSQGARAGAVLLTIHSAPSLHYPAPVLHCVSTPSPIKSILGSLNTVKSLQVKPGIFITSLTYQEILLFYYLSW